MIAKTKRTNAPFSLGVLDDEDHAELSVRLSPWVKRRLEEIAVALKENRKRKKFGVGNLVESAVDHYINKYKAGKISQSDVPYPIPDEELAEVDNGEFNIGPGNFLNSTQAHIPHDQIVDLDKIAKEQKRKRSAVVRDAIYELIEYFRKKGI